MGLKEDIEKLIKEGEEALKEAKTGIVYLDAIGEVTFKEKHELEEAERRLKKYRDALKAIRED